MRPIMSVVWLLVVSSIGLGIAQANPRTDRQDLLIEDQVAPHFELREVLSDDGYNTIFDGQVIEADQLAQLIAVVDTMSANDVEYVEFVWRPIGETNWNLIDADLDTEDDVTWELGSWQPVGLGYPIIELAPVGVDRAGNEDWNPEILIIRTSASVPSAPVRLRVYRAGDAGYQFQLMSQDAPSEIQIFNVAGRRVALLPVPSNAERVTWSGRSMSGEQVANGVYFARVADSDQQARVVVLR